MILSDVGGKTSCLVEALRNKRAIIHQGEGHANDRAHRGAQSPGF